MGRISRVFRATRTFVGRQTFDYVPIIAKRRRDNTFAARSSGKMFLLSQKTDATESFGRNRPLPSKTQYYYSPRYWTHSANAVFFFFFVFICSGLIRGKMSARSPPKRT